MFGALSTCSRNSANDFLKVMRFSTLLDGSNTVKAISLLPGFGTSTLLNALSIQAVLLSFVPSL